jgi:protein tyrosine/serine phosphatase
MLTPLCLCCHTCLVIDSLREINRGGLLLIYQILVDTSQTDIARALQLITASLERQQPCMFFCKLGKDRTGLIAALVLSACGVSEDDIIADYVRLENCGKAYALI